MKEICNTLAEQFAFNSSSDNYNHMFNRYRLKLEKKTIDFDTNDHFSYNDVFTLHELKQAIKVSRDTSPGIDTVHYQLLKHLPEDSLLLLLYIFNHIWLTQDFPTTPYLVPTTPACTWWNRPEEDNSSGKLESTHPSRTSVKSDQGFFGVESVMRVNADSTHPSCCYLDIRDFE